MNLTLINGNGQPYELSLNLGMENDYNIAPEGLKEISLEDWTRDMFCYIKKPAEYRQVRDKENGKYFDLIMFRLGYWGDHNLGFAIMRDWYEGNGKNRNQVITRFCRFGKDEDWKRFEGNFAAQFAGDNS